MRLDAQRHFAARRQQQHLGTSIVCIQQNVGAALQPVGGRTPRAIQRRDRLPRQDQDHRLVTPLHDDAPRFRHLVGIGRAQDDQPGNRTKRGQVLDGLVRRAVLTDGDRVVCEDVDHRQLHQRAQPDGRPAVVTEDQEA